MRGEASSLDLEATKALLLFLPLPFLFLFSFSCLLFLLLPFLLLCNVSHHGLHLVHIGRRRISCVHSEEVEAGVRRLEGRAQCGAVDTVTLLHQISVKCVLLCLRCGAE